MNTDILLSLVSLMLPTDMLTAFNVEKVENDSQRIAIHLEEKIPESISSVDYYESKGFGCPIISLKVPATHDSFRVSRIVAVFFDQ